MIVSKLDKIKKLEKQAQEKKQNILAPCFMEYSPNAGNEAYEWYKIQLEKGYPPEQIIILIDGMSIGKNLYKFDHAAYKEAEKIRQQTGKVPVINFGGCINLQA
jgi:hypothetical protein